MTTTLVTGSTGFIGAHLCRALVAAGHHVRALHRTTSSLAALEGLAVERMPGDITRPDSLRRVMRGVDLVFHTAAAMGAGADPQTQQAITVEGTRNVLQAAAEAGVQRVVHTSSVAALGVPHQPGGSKPLLMDENHTWNERPERWPYGYAKYMAEMEVQTAVAQGLEVVIVNPTIVLGPGDRNRISGNILIQMARHRVPVQTSGGLNAIHIEDVVAGHLAALERGQPGERYILGNENLPLERFLQMVAQVVDVTPPAVSLPSGLVRRLARPARALGSRLPLPVDSHLLSSAGNFFYYDTLKARLQLGFVAERSAYDAITDAYAWYCEQGMI